LRSAGLAPPWREDCHLWHQYPKDCHHWRFSIHQASLVAGNNARKSLIRNKSEMFRAHAADMASLLLKVDSHDLFTVR
jgi:hypothetical protein